MRLKGRVAAITGAGKGIGKCIACEMSKEGAGVAILDFDEVSGSQTQNELVELGCEAIFIKTDVSDYASLEKSKEEVIKRFGRIDILVINAGISQKHTMDEISIEEWNKVLNINLNGSFYTVKAFLDEFKKKSLCDEGKIIFITSGSAITGTGGGAHYAASKSGQHGLMRTVSKELGKNGVNVNAIAPRVIITDLFEQLYPTHREVEELIMQIPIGKLGYPIDIARCACFLASSDSGYIHGQIILMDGGRTY